MAASRPRRRRTRLHAGHMQPQPLEEQHERKERYLQTIPHANPCRSGLTRCSDAEHDQTRPDVRVPPHLVGVGVIPRCASAPTIRCSGRSTALPTVRPMSRLTRAERTISW